MTYNHFPDLLSILSIVVYDYKVRNILAIHPDIVISSVFHVILFICRHLFIYFVALRNQFIRISQLIDK